MYFIQAIDRSICFTSIFIIRIKITFVKFNIG